jgi:hypothetical protein
LWLLHPAVTLLVIVGTANHFWLDALVATALLGIALAVVPSPARRAKARAKAGTASSVESGVPPVPAGSSSSPAPAGRRHGLVGARR